MSYSWNRPLVNLPEELTAIWSCTGEGCKGWIRDSFSFKAQPVCALCQTSMISGERLLPILMSSDREVKKHRQKQRDDANAIE